MMMKMISMLILLGLGGCRHAEASEEAPPSTVLATAGQCMCGEPLPPVYSCEPEWVSEGRRCDGRCDWPGEDVWTCYVPPGGTSDPWAPPNCTLLDGGGGQRRYCCTCPAT
jgi:hypothetical protein